MSSNTSESQGFDDPCVLEFLHRLQHTTSANDLTKSESSRSGGFLRFDLVVKLKDIDLAESQPFEAAGDGPLDCSGEILAFIRHNKHLRRDEWGRGKLAQRLTNDLFCFASAIHRRQIKDIDSTCHRILHSLDTLLVGSRTPDHADTSTSQCQR